MLGSLPSRQGQGDPLSSARRFGLRDYLKMAQRPLNVIPAKAGIQVCMRVLDPGVRRGDGVSEF